MAISFGKLTLNIHVSVNDGDPLTVGHIEIDHVPVRHPDDQGVRGARRRPDEEGGRR